MTSLATNTDYSTTIPNMVSNLPCWLVGEPVSESPTPPPTQTTTSNLPVLDKYEIIFERLLESLSEGITLDDFIGDYAATTMFEDTLQPLTAGRYRTWIAKDKERVLRFEQAMELFTYALADQNIRISDGKNPDGSPSMNDVARSALQVKTRQNLMVAFNQKRFGIVKDVQNPFGSGGITVNITGVESPYTITDSSAITDVKLIED